MVFSNVIQHFDDIFIVNRMNIPDSDWVVEPSTSIVSALNGLNLIELKESNLSLFVQVAKALLLRYHPLSTALTDKVEWSDFRPQILMY